MPCYSKRNLTLITQANIHAFLESDDRIAAVLSGIDEALLELDSMDTNITAYKMQLSVSRFPILPCRRNKAQSVDSRIHTQSVSDDIAYIESQNRGLQVQTANQRALLNSIEQLMVSFRQLGLLVLLTSAKRYYSLLCSKSFK